MRVLGGGEGGILLFLFSLLIGLLGGLLYGLVLCMKGTIDVFSSFVLSVVFLYVSA